MLTIRFAIKIRLKDLKRWKITVTLILAVFLF